MRILIIDDHPVVREVLEAIVQACRADATVVSVDSLAEAGNRCAKTALPELVLLDLGLPGCTGIDSLLHVRKTWPGVAVLVITALDDEYTLKAAMNNGAAGYVPKTAPHAVLAEAIRSVAAGGIYLPDPDLIQPAEADGAGMALRGMKLELSAREVDVLRLLSSGITNAQIADRLGISENTVKHHMHSVFTALHVSTRGEAIVKALSLGIRVH